MKKYILLILFVSNSFAKNVYLEHPHCATRSKKIMIENGPFLFKEIVTTGPHVTLRNPNGTHLYFNCAEGFSQFNKAGQVSYVKNSKDSVGSTVIQDQNWLMIQERGHTTEGYLRDLAIRFIPSLRLKAARQAMEGNAPVGEKPIVITNKNENPVRTQITLNYVERMVEIQDPTDKTQNLKISCNPEGTVSFVVTKNNKKEILKIEGPTVARYKMETPSGIATCYPSVTYNYKTGAIDVAKEAVKYIRNFQFEALKNMPLAPMPPIESPHYGNSEGPRTSNPYMDGSSR